MSTKKELVVSAPGKVILFGEHAVVYGRTALAGSIDLRMTLKLEIPAGEADANEEEEGLVRIQLPNLGLHETMSWPLSQVRAAIAPLIAGNMRASFDSDDDPLGPPQLDVVVPEIQKTLLTLVFQPEITTGQQQQQCGSEETVRGRKTALLVFWYLYCGALIRSRKRPFPLVVTVRSELPQGIGLGSSAAFSSCLSAALLVATGLIPEPPQSSSQQSLPPSANNNALSLKKYSTANTAFTDEANLEQIRRWATAAESLIHGRSSGLDVAICIYGGIATYTPGQRIETLRQGEQLPGLQLLLINTGVERSTAKLVHLVRERRTRLPAVVDPIFDAIDQCGREASRVIEQQQHYHHQSPAVARGGEYEGGEAANGGTTTLTPKVSPKTSPKSPKKTVGVGALDPVEQLDELARINNHLLIALGVGHAKVDQICTLLARYGFHAKMTGAGGGGCLFAFLKPDMATTVRTMILDELAIAGYRTWQPALGGQGLLFNSEGGRK